MSAVDAERLVRRAVQSLVSNERDVWLIAAGKAAPGMASAATEAFGSTLRGGVVVSPVTCASTPPLDVLVGQHPEPGPGSEAAGRRALEVAQNVPPDALLVILLSGGASALLAVPAPGLSLEDKRTTTAILLRAGADIYALNTVRKHLSSIKGGRLASATAATSHTFVLSDVVGDDLSVVASGPTVADASTYDAALGVLEAFGGFAAYPPAIVSHLQRGARGQVPETPKPGDPRLALARTTLIGGRHDAMRGAAEEARRRGYRVVTIEDPVVGEARLAGPKLVGLVRQIARDPGRPTCVIASGETVVRVRGEGRGGRNQELALASIEALSALERPAALASIGTDGIDGPTDAAGGLVDSTTAARAANLGLPPVESVLARNDSYPYLESLGELVRTGPTGTNVGDLQVFLLA